MEVNLINQILIVFYSIFFGAFLGLVYDFTSIVGLILGFKKLNIKVKREILIKNKWNEKLNIILLCLSDIIFFVIASVLIAIFVFGVNNGTVRWYILVGNLIGFVIYRITLGKLISVLLSYISYFIRFLVYKTICHLNLSVKKIIKKLPKKQLKSVRNSNNLFYIGIKNGTK